MSVWREEAISMGEMDKIKKKLKIFLKIWRISLEKKSTN